jgi:hypothetical protein
MRVELQRCPTVSLYSILEYLGKSFEKKGKPEPHLRQSRSLQSTIGVTSFDVEFSTD